MNSPAFSFSSKTFMFFDGEKMAQWSLKKIVKADSWKVILSPIDDTIKWNFWINWIKLSSSNHSKYYINLFKSGWGSFSILVLNCFPFLIETFSKRKRAIYCISMSPIPYHLFKRTLLAERLLSPKGDSKFAIQELSAKRLGCYVEGQSTPNGSYIIQSAYSK